MGSKKSNVQECKGVRTKSWTTDRTGFRSYSFYTGRNEGIPQPFNLIRLDLACLENFKGRFGLILLFRFCFLLSLFWIKEWLLRMFTESVIFHKHLRRSFLFWNLLVWLTSFQKWAKQKQPAIKVGRLCLLAIAWYALLSIFKVLFLIFF